MQQHQHQVINGIDTDIVIQRYSDRTLVLVTQLGKVGNLIQASIPPTTVLPPPPLVPGQLPQPSPAIQLTNLLGGASSEHDQTLRSLYISQIATLVWMSESSSALDLGRKSVIVGLALKQGEDGENGLSKSERSVFHGIMALVQDMLGQYPGL
ncbi:hypothetical protein P691DRAFT_770452 [Macrolepiota fuliginosa MF-IS2]|uniref:Proteasome assembly chaperone 3 n=1 Tax=Macrolepiota fuliginosa MF-IS2 TaxID=1400762 RepID=A0A9P5XQA9_9AGAR|nr:hypothetical protein P691DRAFT_770452 [Macrolepiota fuliginosa MF-IS2]